MNRKKIYVLEPQTKEELKDNKFSIDEIQPCTNKEIKFLEIVKEKYGDMLTVKDLSEILGYAESTIYNHGDRLPRRQAGGNRALYYLESVIIMMRYRDKGINIVKLRKIKKKLKKIIRDLDPKNELESNETNKE